ncbi:MAG: hypothetical protein MASP_00225 [Candidatus Methanolliviera sp. GoM_asphalt]|nr:MAG: hypothetical protein MASP_00225 [Candidatus Methanolliviera sp. GoM_asphalt]
MIKLIAKELKRHSPFTAFGALTGIIIMVVIVFGNLLPKISPVSQNIFYLLHPTHVLLSALVTTAIYMKYGKRKIWLAILIGYTGSIGIATLSDSIIPYLGEVLLDLPNRGIHIGFIEKPLLTNPAAMLGIFIGYQKWITKFPHYGHVLISTWASLFHVIMAIGETVSWIQIIVIFIFLFFAVWIPCCTSDIVYPLLFARKEQEIVSTKS